jgi:hypothetical protein
MDTDGRPPTRNAADGAGGHAELPRRPGYDPKGSDAKAFDRRRRARNWALLAVLLGLSALFYAITLVKMAKGG